MKVTNKQILEISNILYSFSEKKIPFSLVITKNIKIIDDLIKSYNDVRVDIIDKYAQTKDDGTYLGRINPDTNIRIESPKTVNEIEINDLAALYKELEQNDSNVVDIELFPIDMDKLYFDSSLNEKRTISDFLDISVEPILIAKLVEYKLIDLK